MLSEPTPEDVCGTGHPITVDLIHQPRENGNLVRRYSTVMKQGETRPWDPGLHLYGRIEWEQVKELDRLIKLFTSN